MDVDGSTIVPVVIVGIPVVGGESFIPELWLEHEIVVLVGVFCHSLRSWKLRSDPSSARDRRGRRRRHLDSKFLLLLINSCPISYICVYSQKQPSAGLLNFEKYRKFWRNLGIMDSIRERERIGAGRDGM
ncbi:hypothetical protein ISN45_At05g044940 [Arabidopsis thaliana x Arabidopsis arenosa]|uniref:Uncharacterized protein n=1 Tax=Arabidopsis thaliana x Arabidopsis arenosa TaxID=1240361 RepID=A0A8T2DEG2_9BRAS|nr:hypothetical protein ISN45_At05g044940 [Arabidopsis thaliana x Arabidopsis arenosa]